MAKKKFAHLKIRVHPWYIWIFRAVWVAWLVFWAEVAIGSWKEMEQRAFAISLVVCVVSFFLGVILWLRGLRKSRRTYQKLI